MASKTKAHGTNRDPEPQDEEEELDGSSRSFWTGTLSFGLVSIPVNLYSAYRSLDVALHTLAEDGTPLQRRYFCSTDHEPLDRSELVRGYPLEADRYVVLTDEELESLEPKRSRDIELTRFVDAASIPPTYFERAYFLAPGGSSIRAYQLLAATLEKLNKAGIASFVMRGKQHLIAIFSEQGVLVAQTLRFPDELRSPDDIGLKLPQKVPTASVTKMRQAIRRHAKPQLSLQELRDEHAARLHALVERKRKSGKDLVTTQVTEGAPEGPVDNVIDLMAQLKKSLAGNGESKAAPQSKAAHNGKKAAQRRTKRPRKSA